MYHYKTIEQMYDYAHTKGWHNLLMHMLETLARSQQVLEVLGRDSMKKEIKISFADFGMQNKSDIEECLRWLSQLRCDEVDDTDFVFPNMRHQLTNLNSDLTTE